MMTTEERFRLAVSVMPDDPNGGPQTEGERNLVRSIQNDGRILFDKRSGMAMLRKDASGKNIAQIRDLLLNRPVRE